MHKKICYWLVFICFLFLPLAFAKEANAVSGKTPVDSIKSINDEIKKDPHCTDCFERRASLYIENGDFEKAKADCSKAILLNPNSKKAYLFKGISNHLLGAYKLAISNYKSALMIDPQYVAAINNRGVGYFLKGDFTDALSDYNYALEKNNAFAKAYRNRALLYFKMKRYDDAISDYLKAIELESGNATSYYELGLAFDKKGDFLKAKEYYQKFIELLQGSHEDTISGRYSMSSKKQPSAYWQEEKPPILIKQISPIENNNEEQLKRAASYAKDRVQWSTQTPGYPPKYTTPWQDTLAKE